MKKTAGIKPIIKLNAETLATIKRDLLLFDSIGIPLLDKLIDKYKGHPKGCTHHYLVDELEFLGDSGLIFEASKSNVIFKNGQNSIEAQEFNNAVKLVYQLEDIEMKFEAYARLCAMKLNYEDIKRDFISVPILKSFESNIHHPASNSDILKIILEKMPIPSPNTPWENIIDFRSNSDNRGHLAGLRSWSNSMLRNNYSVKEIEDELEHLLFKYSKSLEIHNIKYSIGLFETVIVGTAEFIEQLARLQLSNIAKGLFSARQSKADMLQLELNSEGNELAYIYKANTNFK